MSSKGIRIHEQTNPGFDSIMKSIVIAPLLQCQTNILVGNPNAVIAKLGIDEFSPNQSDATQFCKNLDKVLES